MRIPLFSVLCRAILGQSGNCGRAGSAHSLLMQTIGILTHSD
jgi:hypothetical protein